MDLSKLSDADLQALSKGDMSKVSDEALSHLSSESGVKLSQSGQYASPGENEADSTLGKIGARVTDPNRWQAMLNSTGPAANKNVVAGSPPMTIPAGSAPAALSKLAEFLGKSGVLPAIGRVGANAGVGATEGAMHPSDGESTLDSAKRGAGVGAVLGSGSELLAKPLTALGSYLSRGLSRLTPPQAKAYLDSFRGMGDVINGEPNKITDIKNMLSDPQKASQLQDKAVQAIQDTRAASKQKGLGQAKQLSDVLNGKSANVDTSQLEGIDPRIDEIIHSSKGKALDSGAAGQSSEENFRRLSGLDQSAQTTPVQLNDLNTVKRVLQEKANYKPGTVVDPVQQAKMENYGKLASGTRGQIEQAGGEDVRSLNDEMQQNLLTQKALRQGTRNKPLAFVSSSSPDNAALLDRISKQSGSTALPDFGNQLGAAKTMVAPDTGSGVPSFLSRKAGRAGLSLADLLNNASTLAPAATTNKVFDQNQ